MNRSTILGGSVLDAYRFVVDKDTAASSLLAAAATETAGKTCSEPLVCKAKPAVKKAPPKKKAPAKKKADAGWIPVQQGWSLPPSSLHV
jgi:hypothetical protein